MKELNDDVAAVVQRLKYVTQKIKDYKEDAEDCKATLRELGAGQYVYQGSPVLNVTPTRRFSAGKAKEILPPEVYAKIVVEMVDLDKAKAVLPEALYQLCQEDSGKATVKIK